MHTCVHKYMAGVWTHLVLALRRTTPTSTSATLYAYVNGVLKVTAGANFPSAQTNLNYIGRSIQVDRHYAGSIDSFFIYPWALAPSEVQLVFGATTNTLVCGLSF
jgi:hypothetical protein